MTSPARWMSHRVADAHVLARDLVLVVQGRVRDHHAADGDRLEPRDRRQRAGAPDLDVDGLEDGARLLGRELARDRPARGARDEAEPLLQVEPVDLVDDAVDVVAERRPLAPRSRDRRRAAPRPRGTSFVSGLTVKAAGREPVEHAALGLGRQLAHLAPGIGEEASGRAAVIAGSIWRSEPAAALRGLAKTWLAGGFLALVQRGEILVAHIDLAAHLADRRAALALQLMRNLADGAAYSR